MLTHVWKAVNTCWGTARVLNGTCQTARPLRPATEPHYHCATQYIVSQTQAWIYPNWEKNARTGCCMVAMNIMCNTTPRTCCKNVCMWPIVNPELSPAGLIGSARAAIARTRLEKYILGPHVGNTTTRPTNPKQHTYKINLLRCVNTLLWFYMCTAPRCRTPRSKRMPPSQQGRPTVATTYTA